MPSRASRSTPSPSRPLRAIRSRCRPPPWPCSTTIISRGPRRIVGGARCSRAGNHEQHQVVGPALATTKSRGGATLHAAPALSRSGLAVARILLMLPPTGVSRRDFLRASAVGGVGTALGSLVGLGLPLDAATARAQALRIKDAKATPSVCPYCSVGCATIVHTIDGAIVNIEGDPRSPHSQGALCPKGA